MAAASSVAFPGQVLGAVTTAPPRFPGVLVLTPLAAPFGAGSPCKDFCDVAVLPVGPDAVGRFCMTGLPCCIRELGVVPPLDTPPVPAPHEALVTDDDLRSCEAAQSLTSCRWLAPGDRGLRSFAVSSVDPATAIRAADIRVMCLAFLSAMSFSCLRFSAISASSSSAVL